MQLRIRTASLVLALGLAVFSAEPARAETSGDRAAAEALFQLGQRLMTEGKYTDACPKLEASQKLDPGIGTLLYLGECEEKVGRTASAWATFQEASSLAKSRGDTERAEIAELRSTALRPLLTYLKFEVETTALVPGFELRKNGAVVDPGSFGVGLPTDPGTYAIDASAPNRSPWHANVVLPAKLEGPLVVRVPVLSAPQGSAPVPAGGEQRREAPSDDSNGGSAQATWGLVALGTGALALVTSGVFAFLAKSADNDSKALCRADDPNVCKPEGVQKRDDAKRLATFATGFAIGGGVLAGTGAVLYFTAPSDSNGNEASAGISFAGKF
jgi:serine/threonine-protein kinase